MKTKKILLTVVPALVLGGASLAWADPTATLDAILSTDSGVPQNSEMFDCARPAGHRAHLQVLAQALDSCGNPVHSIFGEATGFQNASAGTTQSITIHDPFTKSIVSGPCGAATQHHAQMQEHLLDTSNGDDITTNLGNPGANPGCWNSDTSTNPAKCVSETQTFTINSQINARGACANHTFTGASLGSTP